MCMCGACVCVCLCMCVRVCVRACVRTCVCKHACMHTLGMFVTILLHTDLNIGIVFYFDAP